MRTPKTTKTAKPPRNARDLKPKKDPRGGEFKPTETFQPQNVKLVKGSG